MRVAAGPAVLALIGTGVHCGGAGTLNRASASLAVVMVRVPVVVVVPEVVPVVVPEVVPVVVPEVVVVVVRTLTGPLSWLSTARLP